MKFIKLSITAFATCLAVASCSSNSTTTTTTDSSATMTTNAAANTGSGAANKAVVDTAMVNNGGNNGTANGTSTHMDARTTGAGSSRAGSAGGNMQGRPHYAGDTLVDHSQKQSTKGFNAEVVPQK